MITRSLCTLTCFVVVAGCAGRVQRAALPPPGQPLTATERADVPAPPPVPSLVRAVNLPEMRSFALANGLRVYVVAQPEAGSIVVGYLARAGGEDRQMATLGLSTLAMRATQHMVAARSPREGADVSAEPPAHVMALRDASYIVATAHTETLDAVLADLATTLRTTELSQDAISSAVAEQLDRLHNGLYDQAGLARLHALRMLYGDTHPLGHDTAGVHENLLRFKVHEVAPHRRRILAPDTSALLLVGNLDVPAALAQVERHLASIPPEREQEPDKPTRHPTEKRARALQTPGRIAHIVQTFHAPPRSHEDAIPFRLLSIIAGELSSSRLNVALREQHEQTYSIFSYYLPHREEGTFSVETEVASEALAATLTQIDATLGRLRVSRVDPHELARAKLHARERIAIALESSADTFGMLSDLLVEGSALPVDLGASLEEELARIDAAGADDLLRVARGYLWSGMRGVSVAGPVFEYADVLADWCGSDYDVFVPKRLLRDF